MRPFLVLAFALSALAASFEVATIKRNPDCRASQRWPSPGRIDFVCVSARELLVISYGAVLQGDAMVTVAPRIEGAPGWVDSERYDLSAKAEGRPSVYEMVGPMLIALLEDRFKLKAHTEPRETAVYALTVAEGAPKLKPAPEGSCKPLDLENLSRRDEQTRYCGHGPSRVENGSVIADWYGITIKELAARVLPIQVGRLVVDRTGLDGRFDIHLEFRRAETQAGEVSAAPLIFGALERQLGLKLTATKAPVDVVVVDSIERPSEN
jgi:uncharacterized protein (TIGR03435 family)